MQIVGGQWDVYEYDILGNRIYNVTGGLPRGELYYSGRPNPVDPDFLLYSSSSGCLQGWSCLHRLTKSTGEVLNYGKEGVFWWSKDGQRIYSQFQYNDFPTDIWNDLTIDTCDYSLSHSSFSPNGTRLAAWGGYYNPDTGYYDLYDILILDMITREPTHIIDMNTMSLAAVDPQTCSNYGEDEDYMDTSPDFHPSDNNQIIFTSNAEGTFGPVYSYRTPFNIYLADIASGTIQQRLTDAPSQEKGYYEAVWSPDGQMILMAGEGLDLVSEIYLMPLSEVVPEKITSEGGVMHYFPRWMRYLE